MSGLNYLKLVIFVILPNLTMPLNATTPSKISWENPDEVDGPLTGRELTDGKRFRTLTAYVGQRGLICCTDSLTLYQTTKF